MTKKIRYSELATPQAPPLTKFTPISSPVVPPPAAQAEPKPVRKSNPANLAGALAKARAAEARQAAETLSHVEARAAAAHARDLAATEARAAAERALADAVVAEPESALAPEATAAAAADLVPTAALEPTDAATLAPDVAERDALEHDRSYASLDDDHVVDAGPRRPLRERARARSGIAELLMFRIGAERFAVELMSVEEAIDLPEVHHVPEMPPAMLGVVTVRGALTPVYTPDGALGVRVEGKNAALIFRAERGRFALAIDDVDDVMTLDLAQLRDAPGVEGADSVVLGVARNGSAIVALVDAEALINSCQAIPALELA